MPLIPYNLIERFLPTATICLLAAGVLACSDETGDVDETPPGPEQLTILRDTYGVPHVFADTLRGAAYGWGYVHAQDSDVRSLVVALHGAMGHSAASFGHDCGSTDCVEGDVSAITFRIPQTVEQGYSLLRPESHTVLEGYAAGVNAFVLQSPQPELPPITPEMVAAYMLYERVGRAYARSQYAYRG